MWHFALPTKNARHACKTGVSCAFWLQNETTLCDIDVTFCTYCENPIPGLAKEKENAMKLAIIQAAVMAALFLIAAAVSYHSGYVGGRVDAEVAR